MPESTMSASTMFISGPWFRIAKTNNSLERKINIQQIGYIIQCRLSFLKLVFFAKQRYKPLCTRLKYQRKQNVRQDNQRYSGKSE